MAQQTSTKKSDAPSNGEPASRPVGDLELKLELPDGREFDSEHTRVDPDTFLRLCEKLLPSILAQPSFWEQREAERCPAEFDLLDPTRVPISYPAEFIDELLGTKGSS
jgi:hypothetical protein